MAAAPARGASEMTVDQWNDAMRQSPIYQSFVQQRGLSASRGGWSRDDQAAWERTLASNGIPIPPGMHIDQGGNLNQRNNLGRNAIITGAVAGAALTGFGLAGMGPLSGLGGGAGAAAGAGGAAAAGGGAAATGGVMAGVGGTALRYGLQYGLPTVAGLWGANQAANAQREGDALMADYYNRALEAEQEEQKYRRGFDEEARGYSRGVSEENQRYGRYSDSYGREDAEERLGYGRAGDTYGRASDEEILAYDRSQAIRDKNYGYQQYGNFVETLEPYRAGGSSAASRMSQLMGGPATADTGSYLNLANTARNSVQAVPTVPGRPTFDYQGTRPTWNYEGSGQPGATGQPSAPGTTTGAPVSTTMPVGGGPQLVRMQAPDGEVREVPADKVEIFEQNGARRVS